VHAAIAALVAVSAIGQVEDERFRRGREAFEEGLARLSEGLFSEAVAAFERSLEHRESAPVLYNLALAYRGLGRPVKALDVLERHAAIAGGEGTDLAAQLRKDLEGRIARVALVVAGEPETLLVDGDPREPRDRELTLDPGSHTFEVRRSGFLPDAVTLALAPGSTTELKLDARKRSLEGTITIEASRPDARIRIDGAVAGFGRHVAKVAPGRYDVEVSADGADAFRRVVEVEPGGEAMVRAELAEVEASIVEAWWLWTGVAVVVVAAVAGGIAYATRDLVEPDDGSLGWSLELRGK
jgi:hypothetical protein